MMKIKTYLLVDRQGGGVVGGQRDEVVEHPRHLTRLPLEALDLVVGELGQWRVVVVGRH